MKNLLFNDLDYNLMVLLVQARDAIRRVRQKELDRYNLSVRESAVLFAIQAIGYQATPAEISRWIFRASHSTSELLFRMEKEGLLRRVKDLPSKNMVRIELTAKGRKAFYQSIKRESYHKILSSLSEEEQQILRSLLRKLRDKALEELGIEREISFPPS